MNKHIALFGGSFDPVHCGHVVAAGEVLRHTDCDELWFVPSYRHPDKSFDTMTDAAHRIAMLELACATHEHMLVSDIEIRRGTQTTDTPTYTIDTLESCAKGLPDARLSWVIGSDLARDIHHWHQAQRLLHYANIIVVPVANEERVDVLLGEALKSKKNQVQYLDKSVLMSSIASRTIRDLIPTNRHWEHLVPNAVAQYIRKNSIYKFSAPIS